MSIQQKNCPECGQPTPADELLMFGGRCEECNLQLPSNYLVQCTNCGCEYASSINEEGLCPECEVQEMLEPKGMDE